MSVLSQRRAALAPLVTAVDELLGAVHAYETTGSDNSMADLLRHVQNTVVALGSTVAALQPRDPDDGMTDAEAETAYFNALKELRCGEALMCRAEATVNGQPDQAHLCELPPGHAGPHHCLECNYSWTVLR